LILDRATFPPVQPSILSKVVGSVDDALCDFHD
jgi:hypothetical protein